MASETFATRAELRQRLRARMGYSTDDAKNNQNIDQLNEYLREAAQWVRDRYEVKRLESEHTITTEVDQRYYNYPANSGPGDIIRVAVWDEDREAYVPLQRRLILPNLDTSDSVSGDDREARRGMPLIFEERSMLSGGTISPKLELWPLPDAAYEVRVEYKAGGAQLTDDTTPCQVDALAILLYAYAEWLDQKGFPERARVQREKAEMRLRDVVGSQRAGQVVRRGEADRLRLRYGVRAGGFREPPNIDTSPSVMP